MKTKLLFFTLFVTGAFLTSPSFAAETIKVTEENYAHAESARNFRNWIKLGANQNIAHLRQLPPRGKKAPTVQMNDDTLYSVVITETENGHVRFSIPEADVYMAVQVTTEGGIGQHYVVGKGDYNLPVETKFAFLVFRTGTEKGLRWLTRRRIKLKLTCSSSVRTSCRTMIMMKLRRGRRG